MTPSEIDSVRRIVREKWPRVKWAETEWEDFDAGLANVALEVEQARAALGNLKRTSEKYPTVAGLLRAILHAAPVRSRRPVEERADEPSTPEYMIGRWRRELCLTNDTPRLQVIIEHWRDTFARSVRIRGEVHERLVAGAHRDLIELAGMSPEEADQWVYHEEKRMTEFVDLAPAQDRAKWAMTRRTDREKLNYMVKALADAHSARPQKVNPGERHKELVSAINKVEGITT